MKQKILELLKGQDGWVSGETISRQLGITRSAVWKSMKQLREEGYRIESVTNKGYRLMASPDVLTPGEILPLLHTHTLGRKIYTYEEVDSTNLQARREAERGAPDGSVFLTENQTAGRGRLGRSWVTSPGMGIWMSALLLPQVRPSDVAQITLIAGLSVCLAIRQATGLPALIKWPNDVVIGSRKVCGILTEMTAEIDRVSSLVVGMGINVNVSSFPEAMQQVATSLFIETGKTYHRAPLVAAVLNAFEQHYQNFLELGITPAFLVQYKQLCVTLGKQVRVTRPGLAIEAKAVDITPGGALLVETEDGRMEVGAGEVSVRGLLGYV